MGKNVRPPYACERNYRAGFFMNSVRQRLSLSYRALRSLSMFNHPPEFHVPASPRLARPSATFRGAQRDEPRRPWRRGVSQRGRFRGRGWRMHVTPSGSDFPLVTATDRPDEAACATGANIARMAEVERVTPPRLRPQPALLRVSLFCDNKTAQWFPLSITTCPWYPSRLRPNRPTVLPFDRRIGPTTILIWVRVEPATGRLNHFILADLFRFSDSFNPSVIPDKSNDVRTP